MVLVRLLLIDPRMPIQGAFHPAVQCQTSRGFVRMSQELFPVLEPGG